MYCKFIRVGEEKECILRKFQIKIFNHIYRNVNPFLIFIDYILKNYLIGKSRTCNVVCVGLMVILGQIGGANIHFA